MNPYRYVVSLRFTHPKIDPESITKSVGLVPFRTWMAGKPRTGPKGNVLSGTNRETYWTARLHKEKSIRSREIALEDYLAKQVKKLKAKEIYFKRIRKTGGHIEFFIGVFCDNNIGAEFPSSLLADMSKLGIDLSLDIYPPEV